MKRRMENHGLFPAPDSKLPLDVLTSKVRLRFSEIESWIPFQFTLLSKERHWQVLDFFYCSRCNLLFDAIRSVKALENESRHDCLDCRTVLCPCSVRNPIPRETSDDWDTSEDVEYDWWVFPREKHSPWSTFAATDDWVLSFWCECGLFNSGHHPPQRFLGKYHCRCAAERPAKQLGRICAGCESSYIGLGTNRCDTCQTLGESETQSSAAFRVGFRLDSRSDEHWMKMSSAHSSSTVRPQFDSWIKYWSKQFSTCEELRTAQTSASSGFLDVEDISDPTSVLRFGAALFVSQLLDVVMATAIENRWKKLSKLDFGDGKEDDDNDDEENKDQEWGELYDPQSVCILPLDPSSIRNDQRAGRQMLKVLLDLSENPQKESGLAVACGYFLAFSIGLPNELSDLVNCYLVSDPMSLIL